jgi:hypothetical protein
LLSHAFSAEELHALLSNADFIVAHENMVSVSDALDLVGIGAQLLREAIKLRSGRSPTICDYEAPQSSAPEWTVPLKAHGIQNPSV